MPKTKAKGRYMSAEEIRNQIDRYQNGYQAHLITREKLDAAKKAAMIWIAQNPHHYVNKTEEFKARFWEIETINEKLKSNDGSLSYCFSRLAKLKEKLREFETTPMPFIDQSVEK